MKTLVRLARIRSLLAQAAERELVAARGEVKILSDRLADLGQQSARARAQCLPAVLAGDAAAAQLSRLEQAAADAAQPRLRAYQTEAVAHCELLEDRYLEACRERAVVEHLLQAEHAEALARADRLAQQALDEAYLKAQWRPGARRASTGRCKVAETTPRRHF